MLFYLLSADELRCILHGLGYEFVGDAIPATIDYYMARTSHGSTLSGVVHSWVLARANRDRAMEFFDLALRSDIADVQGGTTAEGIHLAAMAGSVDLLQRCFTGLETRGDRLIFSPALAETTRSSRVSHLLPGPPPASANQWERSASQCRGRQPAADRDRMPWSSGTTPAGRDCPTDLVIEIVDFAPGSVAH